MKSLIYIPFLMMLHGVLRKMLTEPSNPIRYYLNFTSGFIELNQIISRKIRLEHVGNQCKSCGLDKPIFRMGFCKNCFFTVPQANPSILRPELSTAHLGQGQRDLEWEKKFELQTHIVYLALSGGLKVGVTRDTQVPYRWIDQGASYATIFAKTENRYEAGMIEVLLKDKLSDKTNWRRMLINENPEVDLLQTKSEISSVLDNEQQAMYCKDEKIYEFNYPIEEYPKKVKSLSFSKQKVVEGVLTGVRGQYIYLDNTFVFNIRSHEGYVVDFSIE